MDNTEDSVKATIHFFLTFGMPTIFDLMRHLFQGIIMHKYLATSMFIAALFIMLKTIGAIT